MTSAKELELHSLIKERRVLKRQLGELWDVLRVIVWRAGGGLRITRLDVTEVPPRACLFVDEDVTQGDIVLRLVTEAAEKEGGV